MNEWKSINVDEFRNAVLAMIKSEIIYDKNEDKADSQENIEENKEQQTTSESSKEISQNLSFNDIFITCKRLPFEVIATIQRILFDFQIERLDGKNCLGNMIDFIRIFDQAKNTDENLKFILNCITSAIIKAENIINNEYDISPSYITKYDIEKLSLQEIPLSDLESQYRSLKLSSDLQMLVDFELELIKLLEDPLNFKFNPTITIPRGDIPISCFDLIINQLVDSIRLDHKKQLQKVIDFITDIHRVMQISISDSVYSLMNNIFKWNESSEHLFITRILAAQIILGKSDDLLLFGRLSSKTFLENDLKPYGLAKCFCQSDEFEDVSFIFLSMFIPLAKSLLMPFEDMHSMIYNNYLSTLSNFQAISYDIYESTVSPQDRPKCGLIEYQKIIEQSFVLWSIAISSELLYFNYKSGLYSHIYTKEELYIVYYMMSFTLANAFSAQDQLRICEAFETYSHKQKNAKKGKQKQKKVTGNDIEQYKKERSLDIKICNVMASYYAGLVHFFKYMLNENLFDDISNETMDELSLYEKIASPVQNIQHLTAPSFDEFCVTLSMTQDDHKYRASAILTETKTSIAELVKEGFNSSEADLITKSIVSANIILKGTHSENKIKIDLQKSPIYPTFGFVE